MTRELELSVKLSQKKNRQHVQRKNLNLSVVKIIEFSESLIYWGLTVQQTSGEMGFDSG